MTNSRLPAAGSSFFDLPSIEIDRPKLPASTGERIAAGRRLRARLPRRELGRLSDYDRTPLSILAAQNATRLQDLISLRNDRMSQSPFTFYRGTAALMAADLAADANSGVHVASCGDAHVSNFGFYASPQRSLVFDLNDFDEAAWAPWEWDLKRLVTSVVIAGQASSRDQSVTERAAIATVRAYASALRTAVSRPPIDRYYAHFDADAGVKRLDAEAQGVLKKAIKQARKRTGERAVRRLTAADELGRMRFISEPPALGPLEGAGYRELRQMMRRYINTASADIHQLLRHYVLEDSARRVVGVGSVGTLCALSLLQDGDGNTLLLQSKEAGRSVLEQYGGIVQPRVLLHGIDAHGEGLRVVSLQRVLQAVSDPFLGYMRHEQVDFYVRQFHDMKGSIEADELEDGPFRAYVEACGVVLARAHSQSPMAAIISGYLGGGRKAGAAMLEWSQAYAQRSERDYQQFLASLSNTPESTAHIGARG